MVRLDLESLARALLGQGHARRDAVPDFAETQPLSLRAGKDELVWHESSFDLSRGLDMTEQPFDTLPGELRALFRAQ